MTARCLMVQGCSSSAGKSLLVTALCHHYSRQGLRVAPFKAQNMSNNAAVCADGSEIGRSTAVQAAAAGLKPTVEMNPILIKPEADARSQVIVMGKPWKRLEASSYYPQKPALWEIVTDALDKLRSSFDLVIIEGAGSPVELNLKDSDIVNMAVARYASAPVLLTGDIDRGGIFSQLLGTYWLLPKEEQDLLVGFIINKFRGDLTLFQEGIRILEEKSALPVLGVVPYLPDLYIPEEDSVALDTLQPYRTREKPILDLAVIHLPLISNFDDFDPLVAEPGVRVRYIQHPDQFGQPDAVILPGTKSTIADLSWLWSSGFAAKIRSFADHGGAVVGICGGYQMMGTSIEDPVGAESQLKQIQGLGLFPIQTVFTEEKMTYQAKAKVTAQTGWMAEITDQVISGYEIHHGRTDVKNPWMMIIDRNHTQVQQVDGSVSENGKIWGCYFHGLFQNQLLRRHWLSSLGMDEMPEEPISTDPFLASLTFLTDTVESVLDFETIEGTLWEN